MSVIDVAQWQGMYYAQLMPVIRREDKEELTLLGGLYGYSWQQMLARSIGTSNYLKALIIDGYCHGVVGVRSYAEEPYASIWLICSPIFRKYTISFCKVARAIIENVHDMYPILMNCVSHTSLPLVSPFLLYCGFVIYDTPIYIDGSRWYPFIYRKDRCYQYNITL